MYNTPYSAPRGLRMAYGRCIGDPDPKSGGWEKRSIGSFIGNHGRNGLGICSKLLPLSVLDSNKVTELPHRTRDSGLPRPSVLCTELQIKLCPW